MLTPEIHQMIIERAQKYGARTVWLFGSAMGDYSQARDIDLAVEGVAPEKFFKLYGDLVMDLPKPVDLVDLDNPPPIAHLIRARGVRIYER